MLPAASKKSVLIANLPKGSDAKLKGLKANTPKAASCRFFMAVAVYCPGIYGTVLATANKRLPFLFSVPMEGLTTAQLNHKCRDF